MNGRRLILAAGALADLPPGLARAQDRTVVVLGTATPGGGFPVYGNAFAEVMNAADASLAIEPRNTKGSKENIPLLRRAPEPHVDGGDALVAVHAWTS